MMESQVHVRGSSYVVGLMSGTSMDGIDACVVEITEEETSTAALSLKLVGFLTHPYPAGLKADLLRLSSEGRVREVCSYNVLLGKLFAEAARTVVAKCHLEMESIAVIGSHGQTVYHQPAPDTLYGYLVSSTLQLGDPSIIANECGVRVVGDFRMADIGVGGQGAPLVPYLDRMLLERHCRERGRVGLLLNVGGISNISAFVPGGDAGFIGFDCGPGNVLIDALVKLWFGKEFDEDGDIASSGEVSCALLDRMMKDDFLTQPPPKSTGREYYSMVYVDDLLATCAELGITRESCIATVTEFTAAAVSVNYEHFIRPHIARFIEDPNAMNCDLFVSGGGAKNPFLMRCLRNRFRGFHVASSAEIGTDPDAKEAICFALLAYQAVKGRPTNMPEVTGSRTRTILGKICPVPRQTQH